MQIGQAWLQGIAKASALTISERVSIRHILADFKIRLCPLILPLHSLPFFRPVISYPGLFRQFSCKSAKQVHLASLRSFQSAAFSFEILPQPLPAQIFSVALLRMASSSKFTPNQTPSAANHHHPGHWRFQLLYAACQLICSFRVLRHSAIANLVNSHANQTIISSKA